MLKYLKRHGQVSLSQSPLNDVDRLIFSQLAYLNFPESDVPAGIPLIQAVRQLDFSGGGVPTEARFAFQRKDDQQLCSLLAQSPRYADVIFDGFHCVYHHEAEVQFAALSLRLPDGGMLIAYRGTDNTLAGWKEDFNLAFLEEIPAQALACTLADELAASAAYLDLCGHSKGGNLALYAAACGTTLTKTRLRCAVSFDGPGLSKRVIESAGYRQVQSRLRLVMPRASLVALLFHQPEEEHIIESSVFSLLQHYPYTWLTKGMDFRHAAGQSASMQTLGESIRLTLEKLDPHTRERFVEAVYAILDATGAQTLQELVQGWARNTRVILRQMLRTDRETVLILLRSLGSFWLSVAQALGVPFAAPPEKARD